MSFTTAIAERLNILDPPYALAPEIIETAKRAGVRLARACAVVERESNGRNIFGCDFGNKAIGRAPWCGEEVTRERVQLLRQGGDYTHGMNGVGVTQLTWYVYVEAAEEYGGAHITYNQLRVAFELLKEYEDYGNNGYWPLAAYHSGEDHAEEGMQYADEVLALETEWDILFAGLEDDSGVTHPPLIAAVTEQEWVYGVEASKYIQIPGHPNATFKTNDQCWLRLPGGGYVPAPSEPDPEPEPEPEPTPIPAWDWPWAWHPVGYLGDGSYVDLHPTRYTFEPALDELLRNIVNWWHGWVWVNTYVDHPPGWGLDWVSFDLWAYGGRGYAIDPSVCAEIADYIWNDPNPPYIRWTIWWGEIWTDGVGNQQFWDWDLWSDGPHYKHRHYTMYSTL